MSKVFVRNLFTEYPAGFDQLVRQDKTGPAFALFRSERPLLVQLLGESSLSGDRISISELILPSPCQTSSRATIPT